MQFALFPEVSVCETSENMHTLNLIENVLPTRSRATLVLKKAADHKVTSVLLRKI